MKEICVSDYNQFHTIINSYNKESTVYRGIANSTYELIPKVGRSRKDIEGDTINFEQNILENFKKCAIEYIKIKPEDEWEWLALAQHHGLPTRFLDWTSNPLVAAYFALKEKYEGSDSIIYVLDTSNILKFDKDEFEDPYTIEQPVLFKPDHISPRITAQNGLFIICNTPKETLERTPDINLVKLLIKASFKNELRNILDLYGITEAMLFPGLDGISQYLERTFK